MQASEKLKKFVWRHTVRRILPLPPPCPVSEPVSGYVVGRYLNAGKPEVDLSCSNEQLQAMLDRISDHWQRFGETEPHWSVLTDPVFLQANVSEHLDRFFRDGRVDVDRTLAFADRAGLRPARFRRALDFGCGVGRLTVALAASAEAVVGADISTAHLSEAREVARSRRIKNVQFTRIAAVADIDQLGQFDLIVSLIVLQHNPPPLMAAIYSKLLARLAPGGVAIVQMPTFILGQRFNVAEYLAGDSPAMEMNALPQGEIFRIIAEQGCRPLEVREDGSAGAPSIVSHTFAVTRP